MTPQLKPVLQEPVTQVINIAWHRIWQQVNV